MHRNSVPRLIGWWSLFLVLALHAGLQTGSAQPIVPMPAALPERIDIPVVMMTTGNTQIYQTTSKENLKSVVNPNSKVLNVQRVAGRFDQVMFEALAPGRTKVTLVDVKDRVESVEVVVVSDRVKELRDMIQRSVPTAAVIVNSTDSGNAVVLTGNVLSADDARVVQQIAGQLFGVNVVNNVRIGGVQQVQLEVVVAVVDRSEARSMAFSFVANSNKAYLASVLSPASFANAATNTIAATSTSLSATGANIPFGVLRDNFGFQGYLQALRTEGLAKILAEPRIVTLSGRPANIVSGGEVPILTSSGVGAPSVSYKQFGTVVSFLPIVLGDGKIHLEVSAEISDLNQANGITIAGTTTTSIPGFNTRRARAAVQMEDGQTFALGGLIQNKVNASISRIPVIGDLPFLGVLFSSKTITESEEELVILVTPRLVDPVDCTKIPRYLPGRETRVADDFEFFLEGIMEAPRGPRVVGLHPHQYQAAYKNSPSLAQYPCADGANCQGGNCANGNCAVPPAYPTIFPANGSVQNGRNLGPQPGTSSVPTASPLPASRNVPSVPNGMSPMPTSREATPSLGPVVPAGPTPPLNVPAPVNELGPRQTLPPVSFGNDAPE